MKRSEAVLKIAECLVEPRFDDPIREASHILGRLEKAGMLPPLNTSNAAYEEAARLNIVQFEPEHEWEQEEPSLAELTKGIP